MTDFLEASYRQNPNQAFANHWGSYRETRSHFVLNDLTTRLSQYEGPIRDLVLRWVLQEGNLSPLEIKANCLQAIQADLQRDQISRIVLPALPLFLLRCLREERDIAFTCVELMDRGRKAIVFQDEVIIAKIRERLDLLSFSAAEDYEWDAITRIVKDLANTNPKRIRFGAAIVPVFEALDGLKVLATQDLRDFAETCVRKQNEPVPERKKRHPSRRIYVIAKAFQKARRQDLYVLRNLDPFNPSGFAFWRILSGLVCPAYTEELSEELICRWAVLLNGLAKLGPFFEGKDETPPNSIGLALRKADFSDERVSRFLEAHGIQLQKQVGPMADMLCQKGITVNWIEMACLILDDGSSTDETNRRNIARAFFQR